MRGWWIYFVLVVAASGARHRSSMLREIEDLFNEDNEQDGKLSRREDDREQYMELRAVKDAETGVEITLQNRAAMNTRLRVLYTDADGQPGLVESGRLWAGQTKSVRLPAGAQHVTVVVEKDIFFESWRVAYQGTLTKNNQCLRIVGVTLVSKIHACK